MIYLLDTGVLLRLFDRSDANHRAVRQCIRTLSRSPNSLVTSAQNVAEFWNVSTRPIAARGGYGCSVSQARRRVALIERLFGVIFESEASYVEWRRLVVAYDIHGVAVHDTRLAALMLVHGIQDIVTFNATDFRRYSGIRASGPFDHSQVPSSRNPG